LKAARRRAQRPDPSKARLELREQRPPREPDVKRPTGQRGRAGRRQMGVAQRLIEGHDSDMRGQVIGELRADGVVRGRHDAGPLPATQVIKLFGKCAPTPHLAAWVFGTDHQRMDGMGQDQARQQQTEPHRCGRAEAARLRVLRARSNRSRGRQRWIERRQPLGLNPRVQGMHGKIEQQREQAGEKQKGGE
jgi:hypothetical protein